jgi:hypothetical protein
MSCPYTEGQDGGATRSKQFLSGFFSCSSKPNTCLPKVDNAIRTWCSMAPGEVIFSSKAIIPAQKFGMAVISFSLIRSV